MAVDKYTDGIFKCILKALINWSLTVKFVDRAGQRFGKLVVIEQAGRNELKKVLWRCKCDCGGDVVVVAGSLVTGNTVSCGCYLKEKITKHGGWKKSSYNTWRAMMRRCNNPNDKDYKRYGAKGISVCVRWHDYLNFEADMGEPTGKETMDRIDPKGNYEPSNCRWASPTTQARNVKVRAASASGVKGVIQVSERSWMAYVTSKKKKYYSKCFPTIEEAASARKELEALHWKD